MRERERESVRPEVDKFPVPVPGRSFIHGGDFLILDLSVLPSLRLFFSLSLSVVPSTLMKICSLFFSKWSSLLLPDLFLRSSLSFSLFPFRIDRHFIGYTGKFASLGLHNFLFVWILGLAFLSEIFLSNCFVKAKILALGGCFVCRSLLICLFWERKVHSFGILSYRCSFLS